MSKKAIELGVFTGSSSLAIALGLPDDGKLLAFDVSKEYTTIAKHFWNKAGVSDKIELRLQGAISGLNDLSKHNSELNSYDFAFVDALKVEYLEYHNKLIPLMKIGGVIAYDNTIWDGKVCLPQYDHKDTIAIRHFNDFLRTDDRIDIAMTTLSDGITFVRRIK